MPFQPGNPCEQCASILPSIPFILLALVLVCRLLHGMQLCLFQSGGWAELQIPSTTQQGGSRSCRVLGHSEVLTGKCEVLADDPPVTADSGIARVMAILPQLPREASPNGTEAPTATPPF